MRASRAAADAADGGVTEMDSAAVQPRILSNEKWKTCVDAGLVMVYTKNMATFTAWSRQYATRRGVGQERLVAAAS